MTRAHWRDYLIERGGLVTLVTLALYTWLAPHHVVDGDNSEFATLSVSGGAAHPPGYPLYLLWLRATAWLPGASPAHTAAISTAIIGALGVLVLHAACRAWGARALAATVAVSIFATGPVVLRVVTEAEVFALNNLVVATVLWLAAARGPLRASWRALLLGAIAGLGLANHLTCVLVAPIGLLGIARAAHELRGGGTRRLRAASCAIGLATLGAVLGLSPYAYLLVAPDTPMSWGTVSDLRGLLAMFLREDYGGATAFRATGSDVPTATNLAALARTLARAWLWLPLLAGVGALLVSLARTAPQREPRRGFAMLGLSWLLAGPLLVVRFNVPPEGLGLYVNQRFHLLPALLLALPVAIAFGRFQVRRETLASVLVATVGVVGLAAWSLPYVARVHSPAVEAGAKNLLYSLPPDAVVIHGQDELHAVTGYVQWALGERQDVVVATWPMTPLAWYRERIAARVGSLPGTDASQVAFVRQLLARGRPVFVDRFQRDIISAFSTHPYGVLIRVLPPGTAVPSVREVFEINRALYAEFALDYPRPGPDDEFATEVHARYAAIWTMIATMLERTGDTSAAAHAHALARDLGPRD
jgi:hypothetical protein